MVVSLITCLDMEIVAPARLHLCPRHASLSKSYSLMWFHLQQPHRLHACEVTLPRAIPQEIDCGSDCHDEMSKCLANSQEAPQTVTVDIIRDGSMLSGLKRLAQRHPPSKLLVESL